MAREARGANPSQKPDWNREGRREPERGAGQSYVRVAQHNPPHPPLQGTRGGGSARPREPPLAPWALQVIRSRGRCGQRVRAVHPESHAGNLQLIPGLRGFTPPRPPAPQLRRYTVQDGTH